MNKWDFSLGRIHIGLMNHIWKVPDWNQRWVKWRETSIKHLTRPNSPPSWLISISLTNWKEWRSRTINKTRCIWSKYLIIKNKSKQKIWTPSNTCLIRKGQSIKIIKKHPVLISSSFIQEIKRSQDKKWRQTGRICSITVWKSSVIQALTTSKSPEFRKYWRATGTKSKRRASSFKLMLNKR